MASLHPVIAMKKADFVDYYEVLEASINANFDTIERIFRYLAKRYHPDCSEHGDIKKFSLIVEAYETLKDPTSRASYDQMYESVQQEEAEIVETTGELSNDSSDRHRILSILYAQRRRNMSEPGLASSTIERMVGLPTEVLDFHLWYFRQKGWIEREESGQFSISSGGVDEIENRINKDADNDLRRITDSSNRIEEPV